MCTNERAERSSSAAASAPAVVSSSSIDSRSELSVGWNGHVEGTCEQGKARSIRDRLIEANNLQKSPLQLLWARPHNRYIDTYRSIHGRYIDKTVDISGNDISSIIDRWPVGMYRVSVDTDRYRTLPFTQYHECAKAPLDGRELL